MIQIAVKDVFERDLDVGLLGDEAVRFLQMRDGVRARAKSSPALLAVLGDRARVAGAVPDIGVWAPMCSANAAAVA